MPKSCRVFVAPDPRNPFFLLLESYNIETGGQNIQRSLRISGNNAPPFGVIVVLKVGFGGNHVIIMRKCNILSACGMGIYCIDRNRPQDEPTYF